LEVDRRAWFERSVGAAGLVNFHYHDLRHTFASRLVMKGVPIRAVQEYMGHRTIQMTMRYAHLAPSYQRENIELLCSPGPAKPRLRALAGGKRLKADG
jgi:integrase